MQQKHTFYGVGTHWQNGSVKSYIGYLKQQKPAPCCYMPCKKKQKTLELYFKANALGCTLSSSPLRRIDSTYLDGARARSIS
jgi:hypothetical protein